MKNPLELAPISWGSAPKLDRFGGDGQSALAQGLVSEGIGVPSQHTDSRLASGGNGVDGSLPPSALLLLERRLRGEVDLQPQYSSAKARKRSVRVFLTHNIVELAQLRAGVGLGVYEVITAFQALNI